MMRRAIGIRGRRALLGAGCQAAGFGLLALITAGSAHASVTDTINIGVLQGATYLNLTGSYVGAGLGRDSLTSTVSGYTFAGGNKTSLTSQTNTVTGSKAGSLVFDYNFSFASGCRGNRCNGIYSPTTSPILNINLTPSGGSSGSLFTSFSKFKLLDDTTGKSWTVAYVPGQTSLDLVATIPLVNLKDKFTLQVSLPSGLSGAKGGFNATGSVPIPGALILFGSALAGLGVYGARRRGAMPTA